MITRWIDTHVHLSATSADGVQPEQLATEVAAVLDSSGADLRFVACPNSPEMREMADRPEAILAGAEQMHRVAAQLSGRVYGACMVNPRFLDASLETMDRCFGEWGFVLLGEMVQYIHGYRMDTAPVERLMRKAVEFDVPVQVHISTSNIAQGSFTSGTEELHDFLDLVERVPEPTYLLAHLVGSPKENPTVVEGYLDIIDQRLGGWPGNFWAEIMHFHSPGVPVALARIPHDRLIAGTDYSAHAGAPRLPYGLVAGVRSAAENPYPPSLSTLEDFLAAAGASPETIQAIGWENAARMLKLAV